MKEHKLSLTSAILFNINIMIGSGILIGPGVIAKIAGNASFLSYFIMALFFLPMVLGMVQLSRMFPLSGGFHSYVSAGLNSSWGYIAGWLYLVGYTFTTAIDLLALRGMVEVAIGKTWFTNTPFIFNTIILVAFALLNFLSLRFINKILNSLTIFKLVPIVSLILLIPFFITLDFPVTVGEISMIPYSFPLVIFSYFGFEYSANLSHLIKDSERNAPLAITLGFLSSAFIYTLFDFGLLNLMGKENLVQYGASGFAQFLNLPIPYLKTLLTLMIPIASVLTLVASTNAVLNANSIMMQNLANKNIIKCSSLFSRVNCWDRPWVAIIIQVLITLLLVTFMPNMSILSSVCNISVFMAFVLAFLSLLLLKLRGGCNYRECFIPILAMIIATGLVAYSVYSLGDTFLDRIVYFIPVLSAWILGYFFRKIN